MRRKSTPITKLRTNLNVPPHTLIYKHEPQVYLQPFVVPVYASQFNPFPMQNINDYCNVQCLPPQIYGDYYHPYMSTVVHSLPVFSYEPPQYPQFIENHNYMPLQY